jgi:hypothetical protein
MSVTTDVELTPASCWAIERRIAEVYVTPEIMFSIIKHGVPHRVEVLEGLPPDAELYEAAYADFRQLFVFVVVSSAFAQVPVGSKVPEVMVTFRTVNE